MESSSLGALRVGLAVVLGALTWRHWRLTVNASAENAVDETERNEKEKEKENDSEGNLKEKKVKTVKTARCRLESLEEAVLLHDVAFGSCMKDWTDEYLSRSIGGKNISVHVSVTELLDFADKNFKYEMMPFETFLSRVKSGCEFLYYRSQHSKRNLPSSLEVLGLGRDFQLPADLLESFEMHSTVLRIASTGLCMWLHYDVCDNFLCCVRGRKRVILFHPDDIGALYISGSSSALGSRLLGSDLAQLWKEYPLAREAWARRYEVELNAGDVLFLPAFWPHCTKALPAPHSGRASISVNAFVLQPEMKSLHDPKDVWANRELLPAQDAVKAFEDKVLPALSKLPALPRSFYCRKLASQLLASAERVC